MPIDMIRNKHMNEIINWFENAVISPINKVAIDKIIVKTEKKNVCGVVCGRGVESQRTKRVVLTVFYSKRSHLVKL